MPFALMNIILKSDLPPKGTLAMPFPEGKNEGHFFGGANHTLSINGNFFRSPRDFTLLSQHDKFLFTWHGTFALPSGALLNLQAEMPGGDFYFDPKIGVTVQGMVHSPLFMVNLASPIGPNDAYWAEPTSVNGTMPLQLARTHAITPRNVVIHAAEGNGQAVFTIEGEDLYRREMVEKIAAPATAGNTEGKKAFSHIRRITCNHDCNGKISIGIGNKLGLPVFLPSPGYLLREIIEGQAVNGGIIISGETDIPSATTGDRRGTYTPPANIQLDGKRSIHLLLSLLAPGNIGIPDYAG